MQYSNACVYAIRALARLTLYRPDGYVLLDELCQGTNLPRHFVAKIFQDLVRKGLLTSAKGRGGGFALARPPQQVSLADVVAAVDGPDELDKARDGIVEPLDGTRFKLLPGWPTLGQQVVDYLNTTTLDQLAANLKRGLDEAGSPGHQPQSPSKPLDRGEG